MCANLDSFQEGVKIKDPRCNYDTWGTPATLQKELAGELCPGPAEKLLEMNRN
jgi:hypothetical protein